MLQTLASTSFVQDFLKLVELFRFPSDVSKEILLL